MAEVRGFHGVRYNPQKVEGLFQVISPPYDVISPAEQDRLYGRNPFNVVRLEQGRELPEDTPEDNKYTRAAAQYRAWQQEGVLLPEARPALYLYDQEFAYAGRSYRRRSLLVALRLEPWERGAVLPHEHTMAKPKLDRLSLMRACRAEFSPLLAVYDDCDDKVAEALQRVAEAAPDASFRDENGDAHYIWVIRDDETLLAVEGALAAGPVFMADGHHRYETALAYREERRAAEPSYSGEERYNFVLIALESTADPGMLVLPTHRLVAGPPRLGQSELLFRLSQQFIVNPVPFPAGATPEDRAVQVRAMLEEAAGAEVAVFGLYTSEEDVLYRMALRDVGAVQAQMPEERSAAWKGLDVAILHTALIDGLLRGEGGQWGEVELSFTRDEREALVGVRSGQAWMALFLRPTRPEQVQDVALAGDRMPEKSTYFYPKMPAGVVMYDLG